VTASDAAGNIGPPSSALDVTTPNPDVTPPTAPTNLTAGITVGSVALHWKASTDNVGVTGYYVLRGTTRIASVTTTAYTDTTVRRGKRYTYSAKAFDAAGNVSAKSKTLTVKSA
jgi:fibronectin type 3 domain-containing protein